MKILNSIQVLGRVGDYVYQRVAPGLGNVPEDTTGTLQKRIWVVPTVPPTIKQLARRARMQAAVAEWHSLTPAQRLAWQPDAINRRITAFNAFISARMRAPGLPTLTTWDAGATIWDNGQTQWLDGQIASWDAGATQWDNGQTIFIN